MYKSKNTMRVSKKSISKNKKHKKHKKSLKRSYKRPKKLSEKYSEQIDPKVYESYLNLGVREEPKYIDTEFQIQNHPNIDTISKKLLIDTIGKNTYSLLPYYFIPNINISEQDDYISEMNSGNCVFFAKKVLKALEKKGIQGYLIPATTLKSLIQPGFPEFCHCVVLVRVAEYFIIYEPAFYIIEPIYVPIDGTPKKYSIDVYEKSWSYRYDNTTNRILVEDDNGEQLLYYYLRNIENPSTAISYPVNIHNRRLPIVKYDPLNKKKQAHLSIRLDTNCLEGYQYRELSEDSTDSTDYENHGWFPILDYKSILDSELSDIQKKDQLGSWEGLSNRQCTSLQCNHSDLIDKLFLIINYHYRKE